MVLEIDPKKLLYFAAVIEQGSLNRAAKLLCVSQPALSTSMDRLELNSECSCWNAARKASWPPGTETFFTATQRPSVMKFD